MQVNVNRYLRYFFQPSMGQPFSPPVHDGQELKKTYFAFFDETFKRQDGVKKVNISKTLPRG
jgi:hypothetical protein